MKKLISLLVFCAVSLFCFAEERILFDSSAKADLDGYDYVSNFEMQSLSGYFKNSNLKILEPNERGIRFLATNVPADRSTNYRVVVSYPSFLNDDGSGTGYIYNAAAIKSIKIEATTNRPYDEIYLVYKTSPAGNEKKVLLPQDFNTVKSMEDYELIWDNPNYEPDVNKRNVKSYPVVGSGADGLYLVGFQIKTNAPNGYNAYSDHSVFYLRKVTVIYDKMFTDEQVESGRIIREEFGITPYDSLTVKAKAKVAEKNRVREVEKTLMATEENQQQSDAK